MNPRRPNLSRAGADLAFAALAFAAGVAGAPLWAAALVALAGAGFWYWTRRDALSRVPPSRLAASVAVALLVLFIVLAAAYWLGLSLRGN